MRVHERYTGTVDESHEFTMRCWTTTELEQHAAEAGFEAQIQRGAAGIAADRLLLVGRREAANC
jgi:hypothetical protein